MTIQVRKYRSTLGSGWVVKPMVMVLNLGQMARSMRECLDWVDLGERVEKCSQMGSR